MGRMEGTGFHLPKKRRVRLKDTVDPAVYGDFACVGNEGFIADHREDRFGLPEVLIVWDKNHWAYNGVPDCWTFEEHFELVEDNMDRQEKAQQAALEFANTMASLFAGEEDTQESEAQDLTSRILNAGKSFQDLQPPQKSDPYQEAVAAATAKLQESEGFIVVGAQRTGDILEPFAFGLSKSPKAELAVQGHIAGVAARAHQELVLHALNQLNKSE